MTEIHIAKIATEAFLQREIWREVATTISRITDILTLREKNAIARLQTENERRNIRGKRRTEMIIKKVIDVCKAENTMHILEGAGGIQWISDGFAYYPLHGIPRFEDEDEICRTFDISEKKKDKMDFRFGPITRSGYCVEDAQEGEELCETAPLDLRDGTIPFFVDEKILFMKRKYILPLMDTPEDMISVFARKTAGGDYFVVKCGLMVKAVVTPCRALDELTVRNIEIMAQRCRREIEGMKPRDDEGRRGSEI